MAREQHGLSKSPTYSSWAAMKSRCTNEKSNRASVYFNAGVSYCSEWASFEAFVSDMGVRPEGTSLDRFPARDGNYEKGNCRWATPKEQALNRSTTRWFEWDGLLLSTKDLAAHVGLKRLTLLMRLKRGWSLEKALTTPDDGSSRQKIYLVHGEHLTMKEIEPKYNVSKNTIDTRRKAGVSLDTAVLTPRKQPM